MPNAAGHNRITVVVAGVGAGIAIYAGYDVQTASILTLSTLASGIMLSPDLDTHSESYTNWGILRVLWWPYKVALPHRSTLSHGLFIGAPLRLLYLAVVGSIATLGATWTYQAITDGSSPFGLDVLLYAWRWLVACQTPHLIAALIGVEAGAESHVIADRVYSNWKARRKKR